MSDTTPDAECTVCGERFYSADGHPTLAICSDCVCSTCDGEGTVEVDFDEIVACPDCPEEDYEPPGRDDSTDGQGEVEWESPV